MQLYGIRFTKRINEKQGMIRTDKAVNTDPPTKPIISTVTILDNKKLFQSLN